MKSALPLLSFVLVLVSCSTAYKTGQTPDDVYYSPVRDRYEEVRTDERKYSRSAYDEYADEDRYLRMKIHNRQRWSAYDNDWLSYNRYNNRYYHYNSPWNYYSSWNYYYNPYCQPVIVINPKNSQTYNKPRKYNLHVFDDPQTSPKHPKRTFGNTATQSTPRRDDDNYRGSGQNPGDYLRDYMRGSSSNSGSRSSGNSGSSSGSPSSSSSSSSSSSGSSPKPSSGSSGSSGGSGGNAPPRKF